ncbi:MAG: imidazole glycerol phosphate synthase subunit HisF [Deltaproteobacteria bacterium]|nr:imidazole glycerol phosphate synthase subunit HisF [Deltaproteobacteria bacterium]
MSALPKHRLIASLLVHNGHVVQTRRFRPTNDVGSAFTAVDFFNAWAVDEIIVLEISPDERHLERFEALVEGLSRRCFVPLTVGGKIRDPDRVRAYTRAGADKIALNTAALEQPRLITEIADRFGRQCVVLSIDARRNPDMPSGYEAMGGRGRLPSGRDARAWAREGVALGAGEILLNEIEHDGDKRGYDLDLVRTISDAVDAPVIAFGGVGAWEHLVDGIRLGRAQAVAAGNIFHYTEHSTKKAKEFMARAGVPVRDSTFYKIAMPRRPRYAPF